MADDDYVLGTRDEEAERLGIQHRVWRPRMLEAWQRAGIAPGQLVLDIGAGPGFAAVDLSEIVGPSGRVVALERSSAFVAKIEDRANKLGIRNIEPRQHDISADAFGLSGVDACWCRWVLSFVADPAQTVRHVAAALREGGIAVFHEYAAYSTWRMTPPDPLHEQFRTMVEKSWRETGGEPDAALWLPHWLFERGFEIVAARTHCDVIGPADFAWQWPRSFMAVNAARLQELGYLCADEAERAAVLLDEPAPEARMVTPLVAEIIARKR